MKVAAIDVFVVSLPFRFAVKHNLAARSSSANVIVRCAVESENGFFYGFGEGVPREYVTGESVESALAAIQKQYAPRFFKRQFQPKEDLLKALETEFYDLGLNKVACGASWCALELALIDAFAQAKSLTAASMLQDPEIGIRQQIRYGAMLPFAGKKKTLLMLWFFRLFGFSTVKIKLGKDLEADLVKIKLAREIMGDQATLRVDANCAFSLDEALRAAERMRPFGIASLEQPLPAFDFEGLAKLSRAVPEQIVADESLCTIQDAETLARDKICTGFNIRISKVGGLVAAATIADIAGRWNIGRHLGAQVGESGILSAAARTFASIREPFDNYEGSNNWFLLKQDLTEENLNVGRGGIGKLLKGPGFGVTVTRDKLAAMSAMADPRYLEIIKPAATT